MNVNACHHIRKICLEDANKKYIANKTKKRISEEIAFVFLGIRGISMESV